MINLLRYIVAGLTGYAVYCITLGAWQYFWIKRDIASLEALMKEVDRRIKSGEFTTMSGIFKPLGTAKVL